MAGSRYVCKLCCLALANSCYSGFSRFLQSTFKGLLPRHSLGMLSMADPMPSQTILHINSAGICGLYLSLLG